MTSRTTIAMTTAADVDAAARAHQAFSAEVRDFAARSCNLVNLHRGGRFSADEVFEMLAPLWKQLEAAHGRLEAPSRSEAG